MSNAEILAAATITKGEEAIEGLYRNIRNGEFMPISGAHPANRGLHVNEGLYVGLNGTFTLSSSKKNGLLRKPQYMTILNAQLLTVGLFGHGEVSRSDCGKPLRHGMHKVTLDGRTIKEVPEQFRHCNNARCPVCFRNYVYHKAFDTSEKLWATRSMLARDGYAPVIYQVVLSPPQPFNDPQCVPKFMTVEGFNDYKRTALAILNDRLHSLGGMLVCHPFRQNGEDGKHNAAITGNDGNPEHWRFAPHFHALALFDGIVPLQEVARISAETGWMIKFVSPDKSEVREGRITSLQECRDKMNYLLSHAGLLEPDNGGRRLDSVVEYGNATHRHIRCLTFDSSRHPILQEGYAETSEDGDKLYWLDDLRRSHGENLAICEVERINAAHVFCRASDYKECRSILEELRSSHDLREGDPFPCAELWRVISSDVRFITSFIPYAEEPRNVRRLQVDGEQLWIFFDEAEDYDLYESSPEYLKFCEEADKRDAELIAMGVKI